MHKFSSLLLIIFSLFSGTLSSQVTSSQNSKYIAELETVQSPITGTFISCSMKRTSPLFTSGEQILIHRSTNNTASWNAIDTILPVGDIRLIDPVITVDAIGNYYLIFMRIEDASVAFPYRTTYLDLYRSTDDGLTWQFVSSPYSNYFPDYPQMISKGNGQLFLVFGDPFDSTSISIQEIKFMKSMDGGQTWSSPISFSYPNPQQTGVGIPDINWGSDSSIHVSFGSGFYKGPCHIESDDWGNNWSGQLLSDQNTTQANSSVLSKVISNPTVNFYGIISHRPHYNSTLISYHYKDGNKLGTSIIGNGAYAEGLITHDSIVHVTYNELENDTFRIKYIASGNEGLTFTPPIVLYTAPFENGEYGEYQSLVLGNDNQFYLTFCDWSDSSIAKTLVFQPQLIDFDPILEISDKKPKGDYLIYPNPSQGQLTMHYPKHIVVNEIQISTINGKLITTMNPVPVQNKLNLDLSHLPNGTYLIRFIEKERYVVKRFIKSGN